MANFSRQFPSGFPFQGEIPSTWIEFVDSILTKIPNGTDGSSHVGTLTLGGVIAPHHQDVETAVARSTTGSVVINANVANSVKLTLTPAAPITVTLDFQNVRAGDRLRVMANSDATHRITLSWAGAGLTHQFEGSQESQLTPYEDGGLTMWEGWAQTTGLVYWKAHRLAG